MGSLNVKVLEAGVGVDLENEYMKFTSAQCDVGNSNYEDTCIDNTGYLVLD